MSLSDLMFINDYARRSGKTTAICEAAKKIGAIVIVHNREEAKRVSKEYGVKTISYNENLRPLHGPFLVDSTAVGFAAMEYEGQLKKQQAAIDKLRAALLNISVGDCDDHLEYADEFLDEVSELLGEEK